MVYQDLPHQLCRDGEKMSTVLPLGNLLVRETYISLVNQGCALQGMSRALVAEVTLGDAFQFVIDQRNEGIQSFTVAASPTAQ